MSRAKAKTAVPTNGPPAQSGEILTLAEAAGYLRVTEAELVRAMGPDGPPGRLLGSEWRFLRSALQDWLRTPAPPGSKEAVLSVAGLWKNDPEWERELKDIYERRGRPMTEAGE